ncbi:MAG: DUF2232 domain-containing protein [Clostridia bacterium]|nr:DUF2232 domain-containing protein [Clostridia bacterium]
MEKTVTFKSFIAALAIGLFGAFAGAYSILLLIPAAAGTIYLGVRYGAFHAAAAALFTLLGIFFTHLGDDPAMYSIWGAYSFFVMFTIAGFKFKLPYRVIALVLAAAALISLYLCFGLPSLLAGKAPYDGILEKLRYFDEYYRSMGYVIEDIAELRESIPTTFYGMLVLFAEAASFMTVILSHWFLKSAKADIREMARFREWQLPASLKFGIPVFAAAIVVMYAANMSGAPVALFTVLYMLLPVLAAAGMATAMYIASRGRSTVAFPIKLFVVLAAVMSPYFMALLGAIDLYAGIRRRLIRTDRLIKEAFEKATREKSSTVTVDFGDGNGPQIIARRKDSAFFDNAHDDESEGDNDNDGEKPLGDPADGSHDSSTDTDKNENTDGGEE